MTKPIETAYLEYKEQCIDPIVKTFPNFAGIEKYLQTSFRAGAVALINIISSTSKDDIHKLMQDIRLETKHHLLDMLRDSQPKESCPQSDQDFQSGAI